MAFISLFSCIKNEKKKILKFSYLFLCKKNVGHIINSNPFSLNHFQYEKI